MGFVEQIFKFIITIYHSDIVSPDPLLSFVLYVFYCRTYEQLVIGSEQDYRIVHEQEEL